MKWNPSPDLRNTFHRRTFGGVQITLCVDRRLPSCGTEPNQLKDVFLQHINQAIGSPG
jgi:hypothetical protein